MAGPSLWSATREQAGDASDEPACEPAKPCADLLMMIWLLMSGTAVVVVMVIGVGPLTPRIKDPRATAFALADPHSSLACRMLGGASS